MARDDEAPVVYLDEVHQDIAEFFERHADFLDDDFIDGMLDARGYERVTNWGPPAPRGSGGGGQARRPGPRRQQAGQRGGQRQGGSQGGGYFRGAQRG